jgi:hypothetical protein
VGRPIEITIKTARGLVDSKGAAIIDAREPADYARGHIPGAINLPFDEVITDPARLEAFDPKGKPILVYCGGATCELSMKLGYELVTARARSACSSTPAAGPSGSDGVSGRQGRDPEGA